MWVSYEGLKLKQINHLNFPGYKKQNFTPTTVALNYGLAKVKNILRRYFQKIRFKLKKSFFRICNDDNNRNIFTDSPVVKLPVFLARSGRNDDVTHQLSRTVK